MTFKTSFVCKSNKICLRLNCESVCVCLCLSQDGAFSVFASDRLFSVSSTSQNSVFQILLLLQTKLVLNVINYSHKNTATNQNASSNETANERFSNSGQPIKTTMTSYYPGIHMTSSSENN